MLLGYTLQLQAGESFGVLESNKHPMKSRYCDHCIVQVSAKDEVYFYLYSYPVFVTCEACVLLRITVFDYQRVLQVGVSHNYIPSFPGSSEGAG